QTNLLIYGDFLAAGFQNWSWNSGDNNFTATTPVHGGSTAIAFTGGAWEAISVWHADFNPAPYTNLNFWINGGANGGQVIQIYLDYNNYSQSTPVYTLPALAGGSTWKQFFIPFSAFGTVNITNLSRINFQLTPNGTANAFYLDDFNLSAIQPALVHVAVDATRAVRMADSRWLGLNTAVWDGNFDTPTTSAALAELGTAILRFPGGSLSDEYHWATGRSLNNTWAWSINFANYIHIATNLGAQAMITVNYGTGTSNEAADWVRSANVTNHLNFKYWEVGNECYGSWETDSNSVPHDPYTYALKARDYIRAMKAVDPTIKVGVVSIPGENAYSNNANHFAVNPRTGTTNYGWTPVMLATLKVQGVTPDFLIHHVYPEYGSDNDQALLAGTGNWPGEAANLRQMITDYLGNVGTNTELLVTENNADAGNQGRQSTSIVNGLYLADSLAQLTKTEFNGFIWWDLRNGTDTAGDFNSSLYGWRNYGDLGIINGLNTRHPVFYTYKLMQYFARSGDTILNPTADYALLSTFASRKVDGSLNLLTINKDRSSTMNAQIVIANYIPWTNGLVRSFGLAQDEATRTNSLVPGAQDIATNFLAVAGTNFQAAFPPYSVSLLNLPPAAPKLSVSLAGTQTVLQVQGQAWVRYVLLGSSNLFTWAPVATNTLTANAWNWTNSVAAGWKFWRAVWLPLN
ncbi:MAG TPA: hypothetical protein VF607_05160, partial [Verrucomicrobiae bacterium]